jgi:hypothetical protein
MKLVIFFIKVGFGFLPAILTTSVIAQEISIIPGEPSATPGGVFQNVSSPFTFLVIPTANRSYCCSVIADDTEPYINSITHTPSGHETAFLAFTPRGDAEPVIVGHSLLTGSFANARACYISAISIASRVTVHFGGENGTDTAGNVAVHCDETSLYGGYNTSAAEINYLEITNITDASLAVRVVATNEFSDGSTVIDQSFVLGANRRFDLAIHDLVPAGAFGAIRVLHDGPMGALSAAVSQYKITSLNPLSFDLIGRIPFSARK